MRRLGFLRQVRRSTATPWHGVPEISAEIRVFWPPTEDADTVAAVLRDVYDEAVSELAERFGEGYRPEQ